MADRPLNATAASLLGFLHFGPQTGWDLLKIAEALIGDFWSLTRSQVYRELAAMAERGLVEAGPAGPRDRRPYALTGQGRAAFASWVRQEPGPETIRFPLLLTVTFGRHLPGEQLAAILEEHRRRHAARLADYEARRRRLDDADADPYALATLDFGLHYERAVLDWFAGLPDVLFPERPG
ncbi:MAG TPA: helix-turn-helix transcriptional regulator [Egibacteraceae bacterium]|nr:helix-turn-helix transcriptional regulator [Egibacteraceae bacterium]